MAELHTLEWAVNQLTKPHKHTIPQESGPLTGIEGPLLLVLERAVKSDSGRGTAAGVARTGAPVDLTALALWDKLYKETSEAWPGRGELDQKDKHLIVRLEELLVATYKLGDPVAEATLLEWAKAAITSIRNIVEPPRKTALRGMHCPKCMNYHVLSTAEDGGEVFNPALLVHLSESPVRAECLVCGSEWRGGELLDLNVLIS